MRGTMTIEIELKDRACQWARNALIYRRAVFAATVGFIPGLLPCRHPISYAAFRFRAWRTRRSAFRAIADVWFHDPAWAIIASQKLRDKLDCEPERLSDGSIVLL